MNHGVRNNYYQGKCREDCCRGAAREYEQARRRRLKEELDTVRRANAETAKGVTGYDWFLDGACKNEDPTVFFPPPRDPDALALAKAICDRCAVKAPCLEYALRTCTHDGVFGGYSAEQRRQMRRS